MSVRYPLSEKVELTNELKIWLDSHLLSIHTSHHHGGRICKEANDFDEVGQSNTAGHSYLIHFMVQVSTAEVLVGHLPGRREGFGGINHLKIWLGSHLLSIHTSHYQGRWILDGSNDFDEVGVIDAAGHRNLISGMAIRRDICHEALDRDWPALECGGMHLPRSSRAQNLLWRNITRQQGLDI